MARASSERRLPAELDHDPGRPFALADREHLLLAEGLEVEPVRRVVVGRHRLRVAVDHHGLVAEPAKRPRRMHAAVVELDALADPVRPGAEDHCHRLCRPVARKVVSLAPCRVEVVALALDLSGHRVDASESALPPRRSVSSQRRDLAHEPRMHAVGNVVQVPPGRRRGGVELAARHRLPEGLLEGAADAHRLADRLHLRPERRIRPGELLEREARELDDDVVEGRLEAGRRRPGQVVRDLVERVADRELRGHLGDRVPGRLRRERRRARHARVHLDHAQLARLPVVSELDVRAPALDADGADDRGRRVAQLLIRAVRERHLGRDRDRVARVHAHRIEVLDRADDDDVVVRVAHHLELELVPAAHGLLHQHLPDRALAKADLHLAVRSVWRRCEASTVAAERERGPDDRRRRDAAEVVQGAHDLRGRHHQADRLDRVPEELPVLGTPDDVERRADQLDAELCRAHPPRPGTRQVERGLPAHRRQEADGLSCSSTAATPSKSSGSM